MKKVFLSVFLFSIVFAWACLPQPEKVESAVGITAPDGYSISCATNYTRAVPHYCTFNNISTQLLTADNTCRSVNLVAVFGVPTTVRLVRLSHLHVIVGQNAVGLNQTRLTTFSDASCITTVTPTSGVDMREQVAVAGAATLWSGQPYIFDAPVGPSGVFYYKAQLTACVNCSIGITLHGYFD
jgi:hypothetical protein